jgi:NhaP-type Na+/H+ or K+/H+ antiporter
LTDLNLALAIVGGLVLLVGLFSAPIKRSLLSVPLIALSAGVLVGPSGLGLLDPAGWSGSEHTILEQAARLTVAISLMGIALRVPTGYPFKSWRALAMMLGPVMTFMWLASGLVVWLVLGLPFWLAMLVGAVVTPTDPVLSSTIVTGNMAEEKLPARLRNLLSGESGANDGLAYPFVFLSILMLERPPTGALTHWLTLTVLWEVGAAVALGALIGYGAGWFLELAKNREIIEKPSLLAYTIALSLFVLGATKLLGTDGILAVFAAGIALNLAVDTEAETDAENIQEAVNRFFILPVFVLLGMALPWEEWLALGWKGLALVAAVLLLRRLPSVLGLTPLLKRTREVNGARDALFLGWFGPIGVAALYYATLSVREAGAHEAWVIGSLVISASVLAHGVTAAPFTNLYARRSGEE